MTTQDPRFDASREIRAPRGGTLTCKSWLTEAAYRMLQNNLDAEVAEDPKNLVVYGGIGRAARNWACFDQILESLKGGEDSNERQRAAEAAAAQTQQLELQKVQWMLLIY